MKVLHILGGLDRGGIETWLMQVLERSQRSQVSMDFAVYDDREYDLSATVIEYDGRIIPVGNPTNPLKFVANLVSAIRLNGPYDVVHSHIAEASGLSLVAARIAGVPHRIAHSHNAVLPQSRARLLVNTVLRRSMLINSNLRLACAVDAGNAVFGANTEWRVLHCGIDLEKIERSSNTEPADVEEIRRDSSLVIGHVARIDHNKNQRFTIEVFHELLKQVPDAKLLLVGTGVELDNCRRQVEELNIQDRVTFLGMREDVASLMYHAMDVAVLPSISEGLSVVVLEAQAAGLPMVTSDAVSEEGVYINATVKRLSIDRPVEDWVQTILDISGYGSKFQRQTYVAEMRNSSFDIEVSASTLFNYYRTLVEGVTN